MSCILRLSVLLSSVTVVSSLLVAQENKQFTARELYYAAVEKPASDSGAKTQSGKPAGTTGTTTSASNSNKSGSTTTTASNKKGPTGTTTPPKHVEVATNTQSTQTTQPTQTTTTTQPVKSGSSSSGELPDGGRIVRASLVATAPAPTEGRPLGLKYTVRKLVNDEMVDVPPDTVFHAGDRIRFEVETNEAGYLYIITQGTSGLWRPMFPASEVDAGSNYVEAFHSYAMPPKARYYFDDQVGNEKVFIVLSREPEADLEKIIYSLQGGNTQPVSQPSQPSRPAAPQHLMASASINDSMVGRLRSTYARDLIVETVTDTTPGTRKENAVYVVNPTGSKDSRVVADLVLVHK